MKNREEIERESENIYSTFHMSHYPGELQSSALLLEVLLDIRDQNEAIKQLLTNNKQND